MKSRAEAMMILRLNGWTLDEIGEVFGVTRERVRQILGSTYQAPSARPPEEWDGVVRGPIGLKYWHGGQPCQIGPDGIGRPLVTR